MIHVITPSCRPESLPMVAMNVARARARTELQWTVVLDACIVSEADVPKGIGIDRLIPFRSTVRGSGGNYLRNVAIDEITDSDAWLVMVDDDNLLSLSLVDALIHEPIETDWLMPSRVMPDGSVVWPPAFPESGNIDTAQIVLRRRAVGDLRFGMEYDADGLLAAAVYIRNPTISRRSDIEVTYNGLQLAPPRRWDLVPGWLNVPDMYERVLWEMSAGGSLVEMGIHCGKSTVLLLERMKEWKKPVDFHVVDVWMDPSVRSTWEAVSRWYRPLFAELWMPSTSAAQQFDNESLDAVIIDGDHGYKSVRDDLAAWLPKVRRGGIVAGDDYRNPTWPGVERAVHEALGEVEFIAPMGFFWRKS
jgi:hypothetical protein